MNKIVTSKEAILQISQKMASEKGLQAINMRTVAKACQVSVGSIYNYFPSKADLMIATIEQIWKSFFHMREMCYEFNDFIDCIEWVFQTIRRGTQKYPDFFVAHAQGLDAHSLHQGKELMEKYFRHIQEGMLWVLKQDQQVKTDLFNENFTEEQLIQFVFSNLIQLLSQNQSTCHTLKEIIKRIIY